MVEAEALERRLVGLFREKLHREIPGVETDLLETGVIDSMGFVDLLLHLEQEFGLRVTLDEVDVEHFRSIRQIAAFVAARRDHGGG